MPKCTCFFLVVPYSISQSHLWDLLLGSLEKSSSLHLYMQAHLPPQTMLKALPSLSSISCRSQGLATVATGVLMHGLRVVRDGILESLPTIIIGISDFYLLVARVEVDKGIEEALQREEYEKENLHCGDGAVSCNL